MCKNGEKMQTKSIFNAIRSALEQFLLAISVEWKQVLISSELTAKEWKAMIMNRNNDHWSFNMYTDELNEHRRKEEQKICIKVVKTRPPISTQPFLST